MKLLSPNPPTASQCLTDVLRAISRHGQRLTRLVLSGGHRRPAAPRPNEPHHDLAAEMFGNNTCYNQNDCCFPVPKSICFKITDIVDYLWVEDEDCREMPRPDPDLETISRELSDVHHWIWDRQSRQCSACPRRCGKAQRTWERIKKILAFGTTKPKDFQIYNTQPPNPMGRCWAFGTVLDYDFYALVFPDHADQASYELGSSRISKLQISQPGGSRQLVNFDRGWDIRPDSEVLERAVQIVYKRLAKEVFPSCSLRGIRLMAKRLKRVFGRKGHEFL